MTSLKLKTIEMKTLPALGRVFTAIACCLFTYSAAAEETTQQRIEKLEQELKAIKTQQMNAMPDDKEGRNKTKHHYEFGGFIKATATLSDYSDGELAANSVLRDFYIPAAIPVGGLGESQDFDFSAKETRLNFKSTHELENGEKITTFIEMDFLLPPGGDERISNSYNPRMRHAYFTYQGWLFGQTWSTFQDVGALPESADFLASPDGIVFERQAQVRYSQGNWQFALENPETTVTPYGGGSRIVTDDNATPDLVAKYTHKADWGHLSVAALVRSLSYQTATIDDTTSSTGLSVTGKYRLQSGDDLRFNLASGAGMGRYVGLNTSNGAVLDANDSLHAIDSSLFSIAYQHHWNNEWRSNLIYSGINIDNDTALTGSSATKQINSYQLNLLYSPVPKITLGVGYLNATRELESGADGDMSRWIFTAKYGF